MAADPGSFVTRLTDFFAHLRARGMSLGIGAELDLGRAITHVPVTDRGTFLAACRATLAKSPADLAILERAFDEFWSPAAPTPQGVRSPVSPPADGVPSEATLPSLAPKGLPVGVVRVGTYSPQAPAGGHGLPSVGERRLAAMLAGARRFRRLAGTRPGRRLVRARRGRIDVSGTARRGLSHGGEWIELRRRARKRTRADLMVLWDVSGSMREHDPDLFALTYALQRASRRCRVFAFGNRLTEVTDAFRARPYARAGGVLAARLGRAGGGTRIGGSLEDFRRRYGTHVDDRTTVLILSDGWDLGDARVVDREMRWLRGRAHRLVWVNPYAGRSDFRPETAAMRAAAPHLDVLVGPGHFESRGEPTLRMSENVH